MEEKEQNTNENKVVSKKFMIITASILTLLGICYGFIYFSFFNDTNNDKKEEKKEITCSGTLKYLVDDYYDVRESIEISEKDATELYNKIDLEKLEKIDDELSDYSYELEVCDIKISYSNGGNVVYYKDNYYKLGKYEDDVITLIEKYFNEEEKVLFYALGDNVISYPLSTGDQAAIRDELEKMDYSEVYVDLAILGNYLLVVDNQKIYFDDFDGYADYNGYIVKLSADLLALLKHYTTSNINDGECCSCCPDLKPGESCIALCCPCGNN